METPFFPNMFSLSICKMAPSLILVTPYHHYTPHKDSKYHTICFKIITFFSQNVLFLANTPQKASLSKDTSDNFRQNCDKKNRLYEKKFTQTVFYYHLLSTIFLLYSVFFYHTHRRPRAPCRTGAVLQVQVFD
jgi:predicted metallo-beta-lactamase superfamily hydrolase